jgi:hypothetical protein
MENGKAGEKDETEKTGGHCFRNTCEDVAFSACLSIPEFGGDAAFFSGFPRPVQEEGKDPGHD